jgi:hypothetical protein
MTLNTPINYARYETGFFQKGGAKHKTQGRPGSIEPSTLSADPFPPAWINQ